MVKISLRAKPFSVNRGDPKKGDAKPVNWRHLCGRTSLLDANSNIISIQTFEKSKTISFIMSNLPLKPKQRSPPLTLTHKHTHAYIHTQSAVDISNFGIELACLLASAEPQRGRLFSQRSSIHQACAGASRVCGWARVFLPARFNQSV